MSIYFLSKMSENCEKMYEIKEKQRMIGGFDG